VAAKTRRQLRRADVLADAKYTTIEARHQPLAYCDRREPASSAAVFGELCGARLGQTPVGLPLCHQTKPQDRLRPAFTPFRAR